MCDINYRRHSKPERGSENPKWLIMNRNSWDFKEELLQTFHIQEKTKTLWRVDKGIKHKHSKPDTHEWMRRWIVKQRTEVVACFTQHPDEQCTVFTSTVFAGSSVRTRGVSALSLFFQHCALNSAENMLKIHCKPVHHHSLLQYRQMIFCTLWVCLHSIYCSLFILWKQMWSPSSHKLDFNQVFNNGQLLLCKSLFLS